MKKLLSALLVITFALFFVGCSSTVSTDGYTQGSAWIEVQEFEYFTYEKYASTDIYGTKYTKSSQDFKIRFMNDGSFEIMLIYPNSTNIIRVKPITYTIEYLPE